MPLYVTNPKGDMEPVDTPRPTDSQSPPKSYVRVPPEQKVNFKPKHRPPKKIIWIRIAPNGGGFLAASARNSPSIETKEKRFSGRLVNTALPHDRRRICS
jgi:hypothetical protein